jgi:ACT domain-containing protein
MAEPSLSGGFFMRAVITVIGKDTVGILHKVSGICASHNANVVEVTQSVMQDMFAMIMLADISRMSSDFAALADDMAELGKNEGLAIHCMHEDIFNSMHKI